MFLPVSPKHYLSRLRSLCDTEVAEIIHWRQDDGPTAPRCLSECERSSAWVVVGWDAQTITSITPWWDCGCVELSLESRWLWWERERVSLQDTNSIMSQCVWICRAPSEQRLILMSNSGFAFQYDAMVYAAYLIHRAHYNAPSEQRY